jgi:hypothetical protein
MFGDRIAGREKPIIMEVIDLLWGRLRAVQN